MTLIPLTFVDFKWHVLCLECPLFPAQRSSVVPVVCTPVAVIVRKHKGGVLYIKFL